MKKLLFTIFSFIAIYGTAQVTYGVKAGVNVSKMDEIHTGSDKRVGMYAGAFASIPLSDYGNQFYIQPEIMYSMMGEKETAKNVKKDVNVDYIIAPILFKAYFSEQDTEFFGEIGPQFGFLVNKSVPESDNKFEYKTFDFGPTVGLGFSYLRPWEVRARFYYGLVDVVDNVIDKNGKESKNINSNINIGVAYVF
ncbi:MAG: porin family protein [Weeksellaceae bacterium]